MTPSLMFPDSSWICSVGVSSSLLLPLNLVTVAFTVAEVLSCRGGSERSALVSLLLFHVGSVALPSIRCQYGPPARLQSLHEASVSAAASSL